MPINVLSLFDGISCGQVALNRAGIKVDKYYASEIDERSIAVTQHHFPATIQLGNVEEWKTWDLDFSSIDLIWGGSPCQGFSIAGKRLNFKDPRSKLFFVYLDILRKARKENPNVYFLLENVRMKKECRDIISDLLGIQPIEINSRLVSAQNRRRLYWTNIPHVTCPKDKNILLSDIVHENNPGDALWHKYADKYIASSANPLVVLDKEDKTGKMGYFGCDSQGNRVYYLNNKSVTLCGDSGGLGAKTGLYFFDNENYGREYIRKLTPVECERLQTLPDNYTNVLYKDGKNLSDNMRYKMLGNGWTVDVIAHILKGIKTQ